jgi:hypothetical protein
MARKCHACGTSPEIVQYVAKEYSIIQTAKEIHKMTNNSSNSLTQALQFISTATRM